MAPSRLRRLLPLIAVLAVCGAVRLAFLTSTVLRLEGDEATTGIMAQRILDGHHLAFFAGQSYMGSGEQYLQAAVLWLLPDTPFTLRLPKLALAVLACAGIYLLARRCLGSERRALLAATLFSVGPFYNIMWSLKTSGAYMAAMVIGIAGLLVALSIPSTDDKVAPKLFGFGFVCGLGFWTNWQAAFLLVPAAWWVLGTLRTQVLRRAHMAVAGFCLGAAPSLAHILLTGPLQTTGQHPPSSYASRLGGLYRTGTALFVGTHDGGHPLPAWLPPRVASVLVAGVIAVALALRRRGLLDLVRLRRARREPVDLLLACVVVTPVLFIQSPAALNPTPNYLFPLYAVSSILLAAAVPAATTPLRSWIAPVMAGGMAVLLASQSAIVASRQVNDGGGGAPFVTGELVRTETLPTVIDALTASGAHTVYGDYWLAQPLQFLAGKRLVVSATYAQRFPDLTRAAVCDPSPALVVPIGAPADALRAAITAAGSRAREAHVEGLALFTGIEPGLRPRPSLRMEEALEPALRPPGC